MFSRRQSLPLLALGPAAAFAFQDKNGPAPAPVRWHPRALFNGSPVLFVSNEPRSQAVWMGKKIEFRKDGEIWKALAGVDLAIKPGKYPLRWGENESFLVPVAARAYAASRITVAPRFVQPPPEVAKRIAEEQQVKKKAFSSSPMEERFWKGSFRAPTPTPHTSPFGTRRLYNGKTNSIHQGLDFGAPAGSPIEASNSGRVVIARDMYFEGGFVVIDHGEGIFTLYMHLSAFLVKEGDMVEKGQPIAKSGASGRVTGPHLHFGVQWQGSYLEPGTLLKL
jgi:murein DD-endopeptidase MepM/ murein hydrolase activator NlpD